MKRIVWVLLLLVGFANSPSAQGISSLNEHPTFKHEELKQKWRHHFLQDLFKQRLDAWTTHPQETTENGLAFLLWQRETILEQGFTEEEFLATKQRLIDSLEFLASNQERLHSEFSDRYFADRFEEFLSLSYDIIRQMEQEELSLYIEGFFDRLYPPGEMLKEEEIQERLAALLSSYDQNNEVFIEEGQKETEIELVRNEQEAEFCLANQRVNQGSLDLFYHLPLSEHEKGLIETIVMTIAKKNVIKLAFEKRGLEKKGKKLEENVHPLRFIGYVASTPKLRHALKEIKKNSFKWDGFVGGFGKQMKLENEHDNLMRYVPGFADLVQAEPEQIIRFIRKRDWEGLVIFLM